MLHCTSFYAISLFSNTKFESRGSFAWSNEIDRMIYVHFTMKLYFGTRHDQKYWQIIDNLCSNQIPELHARPIITFRIFSDPSLSRSNASVITSSCCVLTQLLTTSQLPFQRASFQPRYLPSNFVAYDLSSFRFAIKFHSRLDR